MTHLPVEVASGQDAVGDDAVRVARTTFPDPGSERDPRALGHGVHDLLHRHTITRTEVLRGLERIAGVELLV
ncbi:MAG: hypothetical protein JWP75_2003, partial [Frondihabitans sp.]|nr:hypothetical protein [Frondihabitans sp.]